MKRTIRTLLVILFALVYVTLALVLLPTPTKAQTGTGPHGQRTWDFSAGLIAIPTNQDPAVTTRTCTKDGTFGLHNGVLYVCSAGVWNKITMATVTPTPTATNTPTPTP